MSSPKAGASRALTKGLRDSLTLLVAIFVLALCLLAWQGTISLQGFRGAFTPPLPELKAFKDGPAGGSLDEKPAAAPLQAPVQQAGSSRWTEAFSGFMPPFKSWMPPKVIAKAAAWGDRMLGSDMSASSTELSTLKYSFPDALPKVALLFLTRMGIPYEAVWKAFLESVPNFGGQGDSWMLLFNIYVHPPPNVVLHESSIFKNYQMPWDQRIAVEWGQWSVVEAEKLMLAQALSDPLNSRFVLLSETCVPLYPAPLVWAQLQGETRSRLNACANSSEPDDESWRMTYRWNNAMEGPSLNKTHWRKSGQWFALQRRHVQLVVDDTEIAEAFKQHCWVDSEAVANGWGPKAFCPSDEHYIPTLLASKGLDNETDCTGSATSTWWDGPYLHPKEFTTEEINVQLIDKLRGYDSGAESTCDAPGALQASAILLPAVRRSLIELDGLQEGSSIIRRRRHGTDEISHAQRAGRGLKDIRLRQGLPEVDGGEAVATEYVALEAEIGRVLLQWGQSEEGLQEMLIQTIEDKERGESMKPGVLPSWAVPAIEGIPEAIQAASKAASHATEAAKDAVQTVVAAGTTLLPTAEKEHEPGEITPKMAEFLTLAEAVRGLKGKSSTVSHVGSPKPSVSPSEAPAVAAEPVDRRDFWSADQDNSLLEAMLAGYTPLGSASCPLFARKFREEDALTFLSVAEGYLTMPSADLDLQPAANH